MRIKYKEPSQSNNGECNMRQSNHTQYNEDDVVENVKIRYCKYCGGQLNKKNQCISCGKQYMNIGRFFLITLILICAALSCSTLYLWNLNKQYKNLDNEFIARFGKYENPITGEKITGAYSYLKALDAHEEIYNNVYAYNHGEYYHMYGCVLIDMNNENVIKLNIEDAIHEGYMPCAKCCK